MTITIDNPTYHTNDSPRLFQWTLLLSCLLPILNACLLPGAFLGFGGGQRTIYVDWTLAEAGKAVDTCSEGWGYSIMQRKCVKALFPWQNRIAFRTVQDAFTSGLDVDIIEIREGDYHESQIGLGEDGGVMNVSGLTIRNYKEESVTIQNDYATRVTFLLHNTAEDLHFEGFTLEGRKSEPVSGWEPVPGHPNIWRSLYDRGLVQKLYNEGIYGWPVVCILGPGDNNIEGCLADIYDRERYYQDYLRDEDGSVIGLNGYLYIYSDGDPNEEEIIVGGNYAIGSSGGSGGLVELNNMHITGFSHSGVKGNYGWWIHDSRFTDLGLDGYDHHIYTQTVATADNPVIIERNYLSGAMGCAIKLAPEPTINPVPEHYIIRHNIFNGNDACGIFLGSRFSEVYNNTIYDSGIGIWFYNPRSDAHGEPASHDNNVFNNLLDENKLADFQIYYYDGDFSPGYNHVWNNFLGSEAGCVNCFCEYAHYGSENNFISDLQPFFNPSPQDWMDFKLAPQFPWIDQGVDEGDKNAKAIILDEAATTWPPDAAVQDKLGDWDLGAVLSQRTEETLPIPTDTVSQSIDPDDPTRDFPRLEQAPPPTPTDAVKPGKGFILYPNQTETNFSEMTFFWLADSIATDYQIWIESDDQNRQTILVEETISAEVAHCSQDEKICYYKPDISFEPGGYFWWVMGIKDDILGDWSEAMPFTVGGTDQLCYVDLVSPAVEADASPTFSWKSQPGIESYQLYISQDYTGISIFSQWYTADQAQCSGDLCQVSPPLALNDGVYRWEVQSQKGGTLSPWSRSMVFTVMENPPQEIPEPIYPIDPLLINQLTFYWYEVPLADSYDIQIFKDNGEDFAAYTFTAEEALCDWQCHVAIEDSFPDGAYTWQVRAVNSVGAGLWSQTLAFSIDAPPTSPPGTPVQISPSEEQLPAGRVTFSWASEQDVLEYSFWVEDDQKQVLVDEVLLPSDVGCETGPVCTYTPTLQFEPGDYFWFTAARNQAGYSEWSEALLFQIEGE